MTASHNEVADLLPAGSAVNTRGVAPKAHSLRIGSSIAGYALPVAAVAVAVTFCFLPATSEVFPTGPNLRNIAASQSVVALVALAALVPVIGGQFDLSIGATLGLSSIVAAGASAAGQPLVISCLLALAAALLVGTLNAILVARIRVNSLVATLGTASVIAGLVSLYTEDQAIVAGISPSIIQLGTGNWAGLPKPFVLLVIVALILAYVLRCTPYGRYLQSVGANPAASRLVGINEQRVVATSLMLGSVVAGIGGILQLALAGSASPQTGPGFTLAALAAVFLGATAFRPGEFNIQGVLVAVFFVAIIVNGLTLAGAQSWVNDLFNGIALLIAVSVATVAARRTGTSAH